MQICRYQYRRALSGGGKTATPKVPAVPVSNDRIDGGPSPSISCAVHFELLCAITFRNKRTLPNKFSSDIMKNTLD